jgi:two-component system phosphate regulon response regulator PhoB
MASLILIVDDEPDFLAALKYAFEREGFKVRTAADGQSAIKAAAKKKRPELVLLDLMLPDMPGTEVFRRLRSKKKTKHIPIIILTAKGEEIDRVVGFELGADDYVVKPFSTRELILRVRAVLRRSAPREEIPDILNIGPLEIDYGGHLVRVDEEEVSLTALEFRLLAALVERRGRVQTREQLLDAAWENGVTVTERSVDSHVKRLRRKLGPASAFIETIRGVGYRFSSREEA